MHDHKEEDEIDAYFYNDGLIFANEEEDLILSEEDIDDSDCESDDSYDATL